MGALLGCGQRRQGGVGATHTKKRYQYLVLDVALRRRRSAASLKRQGLAVLAQCYGACLTMGLATASTMAISAAESTRATGMMAIREMTALVLPR